MIDLKRYNIYIILAVTLLLTACSTRKNSFVNRNWHAVNTKYNVMYNGKVAFEQGKQGLIASFFDNYWEILPVERMEVSEELFLPGQAKDPSFERAEEKAVKAIQKHSMNIGGKEKNPQIDEAYLLLGQSRYFDQRFVPALEAFNYILYKYPESDKINLAKIWREKTNIRLDYNELAIKNLKKLLDREDLDKPDLAEASAMMAQAYVNIKALDSALPHIKIAAAKTKDNEQKGRYTYIKGQIYNRLGFKDSANIAFDEVIGLKRKTFRIYHINAHIAKIRNFDYQSGDKVALLELLTKLEENRENRPYLDIIYHQIGEYHLEGKSDSIAESYYNKSLRTKTKDKYLKSLNYRTIGDLKFDDAMYKAAGSYYDSTLIQLKPNSKDYRRIKKKRDNLDEVIYYEDEAKETDSLLTVLAMSEEDRVAYYEKYIEELKRLEAEAEEKKRQEIFQSNEFAKGGSSNQPKGKFYFYNQTTVSYGMNEFRKLWGDRKLEDDWRRSNKGIVQKDEVAETVADTAATEKKDIHDPQFYIAKLPQGEKAVDSLKNKRDYAYYQLGLIYKEKFKEYNLAAERLESLLQKDPNERLILPAKYHLFKTYSEINSLKAEMTKKDILNNYPDSRYAEILRNPNTAIALDESSPEVIYAKLYKRYEEQDFANVIQECDKYIVAFTGESMVPKFEFLKVIALGRYEGFIPYKKGLNFVALNYPNSDEGKRAKELLQKAIPALESKKLSKEPKQGEKFKLVYEFALDDEKADETLELISGALKDMYMTSKKVSKDVYDKDKLFVVVHGFDSETSSRGFSELLKNSTKYELEYPNLIISSNNYEIIQIHKNFDEYQKTL